LVLFFKKERLAFDGFTPFSAAQSCVNFKSGRYQMAEVMVSRGLFQPILDAIAALRPLPPVRRSAPQSLTALTVGRGTAFNCRSTQ